MKDRSVSWQTPKGSTARLTYHDVSLTCWVGSACLSTPTIADHPVHGLCLRSGTCWVPIVADVRDEVAAIVAEYTADSAAHDAMMAAYEASLTPVCPHCHTYCHGDCRG